MAHCVVNDTPRSFDFSPETWGQLLETLDCTLVADRRVVTAVPGLVTMDLFAIDGRRPAAFDFSGTGTTSSETPRSLSCAANFNTASRAEGGLARLGPLVMMIGSGASGPRPVRALRSGR